MKMHMHWFQMIEWSLSCFVLRFYCQFMFVFFFCRFFSSSSSSSSQACACHEAHGTQVWPSLVENEDCVHCVQIEQQRNKKVEKRKTVGHVQTDLAVLFGNVNDTLLPIFVLKCVIFDVKAMDVHRVATATTKQQQLQRQQKDTLSMQLICDAYLSNTCSCFKLVAHKRTHTAQQRVHQQHHQQQR